MKIINRALRFINRKRHSAGHGVHSQFAFELIMNTIHTPYSYYSYQDNKNKLKQAGLENYSDIKYAKLLFRLTNRFNSKKILEIGSGIGVNTLYLTASSKQTKITCVEQEKEKIKNAQSLLANKLENIILTEVLPINECRFDAIVWDLKQHSHKKDEVIELISKTIKSEGFVVINHINKGKENKEVWQNTLQLKNLTMSFDLGATGIGFFKPSLPKLNYDLYF
ncbi:MAG: methyltransferase domain-containing protein [Bacteroidales bacterium]|nr:methyltransferase domain-containing protein [Bacteroidales bacterium]